MPTLPHPLVDGEKATIDPGDQRDPGVPWTFLLPDTITNGTACSIKAITDDQTPITVTAQGTATVEDPRTPGTSQASINFPFRGVGSLTFTYNAGRDMWVIYETASLIGALQVTGIWDVAKAYVKNDLVRYHGGQWVCNIDNTGVEPTVALLTTTQEWFPLVYTGSANVNQVADQTIGTIGTADWVTLNIDNEQMAPVGVTVDLVGNQYAIDFRGVWQQAGSLFFQHDNAQGSRNIQLRLWDPIGLVSYGSVTIGIGRNVTDTNAAVTMLNRVEAAIGVNLQWQIGGPDTIVNDVVITTFTVGLIQASV